MGGGGYPNPSWWGVPPSFLTGGCPHPSLEQYSMYLLHGGRYASCVHAAGLSCHIGFGFSYWVSYFLMWFQSIKRDQFFVILMAGPPDVCAISTISLIAQPVRRWHITYKFGWHVILKSRKSRIFLQFSLVKHSYWNRCTKKDENKNVLEANNNYIFHNSFKLRR